MEQLLTVTSAMVAAGKAEVSLLNKYLKEYSELIFGTRKGSKKPILNEKEDLYKNMQGFRSLFKEKITFRPKVGKKIDAEFDNVSLEELMKTESN